LQRSFRGNERGMSVVVLDKDPAEEDVPTVLFRPRDAEG
jgi:hypothetical protein